MSDPRASDRTPGGAAAGGGPWYTRRYRRPGGKPGTGPDDQLANGCNCRSRAVSPSSLVSVQRFIQVEFPSPVFSGSGRP
eukprot:754210-Hanusia_phi.AAC.1